MLPGPLLTHPVGGPMRPWLAVLAVVSWASLAPAEGFSGKVIGVSGY